MLLLLVIFIHYISPPLWIFRSHFIYNSHQGTNLRHFLLPSYLWPELNFSVAFSTIANAKQTLQLSVEFWPCNQTHLVKIVHFWFQYPQRIFLNVTMLSITLSPAIPRSWLSKNVKRHSSVFLSSASNCILYYYHASISVQSCETQQYEEKKALHILKGNFKSCFLKYMFKEKNKRRCPNKSLPRLTLFSFIQHNIEFSAVWCEASNYINEIA